MTRIAWLRTVIGYRSLPRSLYDETMRLMLSGRFRLGLKEPLAIFADRFFRLPDVEIESAGNHGHCLRAASML
jgi:hypothetical protein